MYWGVPAMTPLWVWLASSTARASPKSVIFARSTPFSRRMLAGFTSRWINPWACAAASPDATCMPMRRTSTSGRAPVRSRRSCREMPGTYSITRYGWPSASSTSWIATTCSWLTAAAARASRANRRRAGALLARWGAIALTATSRCKEASNAR